MPSIAVTGANGLIGAAVLRRFTAKGWKSIGLVRDPASLPPGAEARPYDLAGAVPSLAGADWLVHAAHAVGDERVNLDGTQRLVDRARADGVRRTLFFSSLAAHAEATSAYGRHKLACEPLFDAVIRPGLVLGDGGLVRRTAAFMRRRHVAPLIAGGRQPLQTVGVDDLVTAVERVADGDRTGVLTVADPSRTTYRDVYTAIARALGVRVVFVPVPYGPLEAALRAASALHLPVGVGVDNLRGLRQARYVDSRADLESLELQLEPMKAALQRFLGPS